MSKAEQRALEAYPEMDMFRAPNPYKTQLRKDRRKCFRQGYEQAVQDIISLIESRIEENLGDAQPAPILRIELQELIDKIKEGK